MKQKSIRIAMGSVCLILALAITVQVRTMTVENSVVSQSFADDALKDSLLEWKEKYDKTSVALSESSKELETIRKESTSDVGDSTEKTDKLKQNNLLLGLTNVKGNGVIITLKDTQLTSISDAYGDHLVHDGDLREILNELANAGAEAVEINGQRVVSTTCIMCAGNVISVNGEKVSSPCTIKAIGNQEILYGSLARAGGTIQLLKDHISVELKKASNIEIAKYSGALTQKYLKVVGE